MEHAVQNCNSGGEAAADAGTQRAWQAGLASAMLCGVNTMKKLGLFVLLLVVVVVAGVAFLRPQRHEPPPAKSEGAGKDARAAPAAEGAWSQVQSFVAHIFASKKSGVVSAASKLGLTVIHQSPAEQDTNAPAAAGTAPAEASAHVQAGLQAVHQLSIRGIIMSATRASAVINTGRQDASVFVGDEFNVRTPDGLVALRCEKIEPRTVWLRIPQTTVLAELRLP